MDEPQGIDEMVAAMRAEMPEPVRGLFDLGPAAWGYTMPASAWPDYAALGVTREHAKAMGRLLLDDRMAVFEDVPDEVAAGWLTLHLPRALARVRRGRGGHAADRSVAA